MPSPEIANRSWLKKQKHSAASCEYHPETNDRLRDAALWARRLRVASRLFPTSLHPRLGRRAFQGAPVELSSGETTRAHESVGGGAQASRLPSAVCLPVADSYPKLKGVYSEGGLFPWANKTKIGTKGGMCKKKKRGRVFLGGWEESRPLPSRRAPSLRYSTLKVIPLRCRLNSHSAFVSLIPYCLFWSRGPPASVLSAVTVARACVCVCAMQSKRERENKQQREGQPVFKFLLQYQPHPASQPASHPTDKSSSCCMQTKGLTCLSSRATKKATRKALCCVFAAILSLTPSTFFSFFFLTWQHNAGSRLSQAPRPDRSVPTKYNMRDGCRWKECKCKSQMSLSLAFRPANKGRLWSPVSSC